MPPAHRKAISDGLRRSSKKTGRPRTPVVHGTVNGYVNKRCRCPLCREAWRVYWHEHKKASDRAPGQKCQPGCTCGRHRKRVAA